MYKIFTAPIWGGGVSVLNILPRVLKIVFTVLIFFIQIKYYAILSTKFMTHKPYMCLIFWQ